jgi:hypothetical protein
MDSAAGAAQSDGGKPKVNIDNECVQLFDRAMLG